MIPVSIKDEHCIEFLMRILCNNGVLVLHPFLPFALLLVRTLCSCGWVSGRWGLTCVFCLCRVDCHCAYPNLCWSTLFRHVRGVSLFGFLFFSFLFFFFLLLLLLLSVFVFSPSFGFLSVTCSFVLLIAGCDSCPVACAVYPCGVSLPVSACACAVCFHSPSCCRPRNTPCSRVFNCILVIILFH